ncbi:MAG: hypothetical protein GY847_07690 [Proteobacteria bacterium]|nr:hypothetical protein [Pseudomonadota bacterium]
MIFDGPTPSGTIWEEATEDSGCRLFTPRVPFCNEPCVGGAICVEDGQCQQYPSPVSVGTVEVEGVRTDSGEISFSMDPIAGNYQSAGIDLAYPAFSEGDEITITAQGDSYTPPFTLKTTGISPLQGLNKSIALEDGQAVTLTWDRPEQTNAAGIHLKLDISHHGGSKGKIECDTEDTGSFVLPAALLDQLKSLGIAGFPTLIVSRESIGSAPISEVGPVDLVIGSTVELPVKIPGLTSCFDDKDCPEGQTCGVDRACH